MSEEKKVKKYTVLDMDIDGLASTKYDVYRDFLISGQSYICPIGSRPIYAFYKKGDIPVCINPETKELVSAIKGEIINKKGD